MLDFTPDQKIAELINRIVNRADTLGIITKYYDRLTCIMDLEAAMTSCKPPLDLVALIEFDDIDFLHDVTGLALRINRSTGQLEGCFLPLCCRPASS